MKRAASFVMERTASPRFLDELDLWLFAEEYIPPDERTKPVDFGKRPWPPVDFITGDHWQSISDGEHYIVSRGDNNKKPYWWHVSKRNGHITVCDKCLIADHDHCNVTVGSGMYAHRCMCPTGYCGGSVGR